MADVADLERAEREAFADLFAALPAGLARDLGAACTRIAGAACWVARAAPQAPELARVSGLGVEAPASDGDLDAVGAFYAEAPHLVSVVPGIDLEDRLAARGYEPGYPWMKFARVPDAAATAPTGLRIEQVGANGAFHFASAVTGGFGMPPIMTRWLAHLPGRPNWVCLVAYDETHEPVGGGALYLHDGVGWLGLGATLPAARGRGAQSAILAERVAIAARAGCRLVVTETGVRREGRPERSYRNILRAGFDERYERPNWRPAA